MKLKNAFNVSKRATRLGNAGYDNARENIDPHIKTKVLNSDESNFSGDMIFTKTGSGLSYGEMYTVNNVVTMSLNSARIDQVVVFSDNGNSNLTTPDHAQDHITVEKTGVYMVNVSISVHNEASQAILIWFDIKTNGGTVLYSNMRKRRALAAGHGFEGSMSLQGLCLFNAGDTVELWASCTTAAERVIQIDDVTLSIFQIGG